MKRLALLALLCFPALLPAQPSREGSSCEICHSLAAAEHRGAAHQTAGLTCVTCHGGDPTDFTESAMAPAAGFRGAPSRREQPAWCAECHADPALMRPYGLPTAQYQRYQESRHGQALVAGRSPTAVCTDCHGIHDSLPATDARSRVAPANVPATCGGCHGDPATMAASGLPTTQYAAYRTDAHGQALLQDGRPTAPSCATCHDSHGAAPPALSSVDKVCGRCHRRTQQQFATSPHATAEIDGCLACHRAHGVRAARPTRLVESCRECHAGEPAIMAEAETLQTELVEAHRRYEATAARIEAGHGDLPDAAALEEELQQARSALLGSAVAQHSLRLRDVERETAVVDAVSEHLEEALRERVDRRHFRLLVLAYTWILLLLPIGAMAIWRQQFERERRAGGDRS